MTFVFEHTAFDAKDICRLCLRDIIPLFDIFSLDDSNDSNEPSYAKMISTIGNIPVNFSIIIFSIYSMLFCNNNELSII